MPHFKFYKIYICECIPHSITRRTINYYTKTNHLVQLLCTVRCTRIVTRVQEKYKRNNNLIITLGISITLVYHPIHTEQFQKVEWVDNEWIFFRFCVLTLDHHRHSPQLIVFIGKAKNLCFFLTFHTMDTNTCVLKRTRIG